MTKRDIVQNIEDIQFKKQVAALRSYAFKALFGAYKRNQERKERLLDELDRN